MMSKKHEILGEMIAEAQKFFNYHLEEMTKYEQRINVLESYKKGEIQNPSLN